MNYSPRKVELRRKQVSALLAQAATEEEIAQKLNVDQSTKSRLMTSSKVSLKSLLSLFSLRVSRYQLVL